MTPIEDVQQLAHDTIVAAAFFTAWASEVFVSDGLENASEEAALTTTGKGRHVTILPILDGETTSQGGGKAVVRVGLGVRVAVNSEIHSGSALEIMREVKTALLNYNALPKEQFSLARRAFALDTTDPGVTSYVMFFEKACVF